MITLLQKEQVFAQEAEMPPDRTLIHMLKCAKKMALTWGKNKAIERRANEVRLHAEYAAAQLELENDPQSVTAQENLEAKSESLHQYESKQLLWMSQMNEVNSIVSDDKCSAKFFASFKAQSIDSEISAVRDEAGILHTGWDNIAGQFTGFYSKLFASAQCMDDASLCTMLQAQNSRISDDARERCEAEFDLDELYRAASEMAKKKASGPDCIPLEFYITFWEHIGPVLLSMLNHGIDVGAYSVEIVKGVMLLIPKNKGNPLMVNNRRPITLLNLGLKIGTKAMEMRTDDEMNTFVSWHQHGFLKGRSIHNSLLLANEMAYKASRYERDLIMLKLDEVKAFDSLEWDFIKVLLDHIGFGPRFLAFFHAITGNASSVLRINGRHSAEIQRSVRQGDPLSSIIFVIAMDALSKMLLAEMEKGFIRGIQVPEIGLHYCHNMYADDTSVIIEANKEVIEHTMRAFNTFGSVSGLYVNWVGTAAVWLSPQPIPQELDYLEWKWEEPQQHSKLLRFPFGVGISAEQVLEQIITKFEARPAGMKLHQLSFMARVTYINHLVMGSMWFLLSLWPGNDQALHRIIRVIMKALWEGKMERVDYDTLIKSKADEGVALLDFQAQVCSLAGKLVIWSLWEGAHPLKLVLQEEFHKLSNLQWGTKDFAWDFHECHTLPADVSPVLRNVCHS